MISPEELLNQFETLGCCVEGDDVLQKCVELCRQLGKNEEQFVESWLEFSGAHYGDFNPTVKRLEEMLASKKPPVSDVKRERDAVQDIEGFDGNFEDDEDILQLYGYNQGDASKAKKQKTPEPAVKQETKFGDVQAPSVTEKGTPKTYKDSGRVLLTFGKKIATWKPLPKTKLDIQEVGHNRIDNATTFGFELLSDKVRVLQSVNRSLGQELCTAWHQADKADITYTSLSNIKAQKPMRTWGRIRCDKSQAGKTTVYLEGCSRVTEQRDVTLDKLENYIELDLSRIPSYSLFPGEIVAVEATNPTGSTLIVSRIFDDHLLEKVTTNPLADNLRLVVASGPFSTLDSLNCDPLWDLLDRIADEDPHVLLLGGPFIDCNHPELKEYKAMTFQELFDSLIRKLMARFEGKSTQVVIVASHRDIHHDCVYPTPQYTAPKGLKNLHLMPDPCKLSIDGLTINMTTVDSIMHLGRKEIVQKPTNADKLGRLANYILSQGFFYPLYPPAKEITLDMTHWHKHAYMETSPHLLILPSDMRHFCKPINGTVVVNPERLNKRTYARIEVRPAHNSAWSHEQVSCEIVKV